MSEEQKPINLSTLLAFAVLIALVLLLPVYWKWIGYEPAPPPPEQAADTATTPAATDFNQTVPASGGQLSADLTDRPQIADSAAAFFLAPADWSEETVVVSTPHLEATFSNRGARLTRLVLRDYQYTDDARRGQPIVFLDEGNTAGPLFRFAHAAGDLHTALFTVDRNNLTLTGGDSAVVRFTVTTRTGSEWTVAYTFNGDRYDFQTRLQIPDPWEAGVERELYYGWVGGLPSTEPNPKSDNSSFAALALMGTDLEKIGSVDREEPVRHFSGETHWAAVRTKYFTCATIPATAAAGFRSEAHETPLTFDGETIKLKQFSAQVRSELRTGEPIDLTYTVYSGPVDYDILKRYGAGLEEMVNLGWRWLVRPFSLVILWLFQKLYSVIPNYGVVIILFSIAIKALFHPLTKKQMRSMRRMQALQPRIEKLRERHKKDPQKLNKETMKLYKDAGVNPMAGCLPLLPQMPIFYALFNVFRTAIELRGAYFVGWLTDLSQMDPYYILPILMTLAMFAQQKLSTKDPKQKMLTYLMPIIFGFMFRNFPAGLTLYWTFFNLSSVAEQAWLIGHPSEDGEVNGEVGSGKVERNRPKGESRKR